MKSSAKRRPTGHEHPGYHWNSDVNEAEKAKHYTKPRIRARVEHVFEIMKQVFGFQKVRYRGLKKSLHRLEVTAALINLFIGRRQVLGVQARCAC